MIHKFSAGETVPDWIMVIEPTEASEGIPIISFGSDVLVYDFGDQIQISSRGNGDYVIELSSQNREIVSGANLRNPDGKTIYISQPTS